MNLRIRDYGLTSNCHKLYDVILNGEIEIETVVTHDPSSVCDWINNTEILNESRLDRLIIGLDIEWRPNINPGAAQTPVATLQLCVGKSCLIYQILYAPNIPRKLRNFLNNENYRFVGVGIDNDVVMLRNDHGLDVSNIVDLRAWAAEELENDNLRNVGLKYLVKEIVGIEIEKPQCVRRSCWDQRWLSRDQIVYACLDAYLSFEVGRLLSAWY